MKKLLAIFFIAFYVVAHAQGKAEDSVVINVGVASKIMVVIKDKKDLETLKTYNIQSLMNDIISKMEKSDTASAMKPSTAYLNDTTRTIITKKTTDSDETESLSSSPKGKTVEVKGKTIYRGTRQSVSFDLGTNNYVSDGKFPDSGTSRYAVRPWGSWYFAANSVHRSRLAKKFFMEWGLGLSFYNFKFQEDNIRMVKDAVSVQFEEDTRDVDFKKSKLTAMFINASIIPVLDFGQNARKPVLFDGRSSESFRIGFGPYAGYRLDSYSKVVFKDQGEKRKERDHDSFYLNNFRYGLRLQVGYRNTDLFFNYDLNNLFADGKGPNLNAFSFGVSF